MLNFGIFLDIFDIYIKFISFKHIFTENENFNYMCIESKNLMITKMIFTIGIVV